ncbi:MAG: AMIN domain-containing protein [Candidatus Zixiibacteriota bacterium]|nr:MAG: AMIN domain-containing protein [candidate division Zixibacteria bacterium]
MKKMLTLAVIAAVLLGVGHAMAADVTRVDLSYTDGSTMARINVEGGIRFTHQTEVAKDGKPFRVIVDILSATHKLGANNFTSLPDCPIQSIRTSQFSVKPEAVVRVVFDMEGEQVYRVDSDNQWITLYFADKASRQFANWSTAGTAAPPKPTKPKVASAPVKKAEKSAAELNKSIKNDHLASLEPKGEATEKPAPAKKEKPKKKVTRAPGTVAKATEGDALYGPFADVSLTKEKKPVPEKETPKAQPKSVVKTPAEPARASSAPSGKQPAPAKAEKPSVTEVAKSEVPKPKPAVAEKPAPVAAKQSDTKVASTESGDSKRSTSRFRRTPAQSKKIKGTLVAEFPKRLVIKYKAKRYRDPFATLLDESKTYDSPVERQVPNVEGLKLVGVIQAGVKDNRALFEDKEGYGYILKTGDKVQKGYVLRVESDRVYFQIFEYGWSRTVALHLES